MIKKLIALSYSSVQRYAWPFHKRPCHNRHSLVSYQRLGCIYLIASTSTSFVVYDSVPLPCRRTEAKKKGMFLLFLKNILLHLQLLLKNWLYSLCCTISPYSLLTLYIVLCTSYFPSPVLSLPPFLSPLITTSLFSVNLLLFFYSLICCIFQIPHITGNTVFVFV